MKKQFIVDEEGKKIAVILPMKEYEKMINNLEELEDVLLYNKAKLQGKLHGIEIGEYLQLRMGK